MIWLVIRLTQLPLEALNIKDINKALPQAVIEDNQIICMNVIASQYGVKVNHTISSAYALCENIQLYQRNISQEKQKLDSLALLLYRYSPSICIEEYSLILIEIGASLKLYRTIENLLKLIKKTLNHEITSYMLGLGDNPTSAELATYLTESDLCKTNLLEYWQADKQEINVSQLHQAISNLPVSQLSIAPKSIEMLQSAGIKLIKELQKIPQKSIRKRFGKELTNYLGKLNSTYPELKSYFIPPEFFYQKVELINVIHHRQGLFSPIKKLIKNLCHFLISKQQSTQFLEWCFWDSEKNFFQFEVLITENFFNENNYFELTELTLENYQLKAPIEAISLKVNQLNAISLENKNLFGAYDKFEENLNFVNKIRAKVGHKSCIRFKGCNDFLPERSFELSQIDSALSEKMNGLSGSNNTSGKLSKPSWLLDPPIAIDYRKNNLHWHGKLKIISSPERITSHWWEEKTARDYFLARHDSGIIYWIFFEKMNKQWFIHGVYS